MRTPTRISWTVPLAILAVSSVLLFAQRSTTPAAPASQPAAGATAKIVGAADALIKALDDGGRTKLQFPFEGPQKTRWSNLPSPMFKHEGIRLADLTPAQRAAVTTLLTAALSADGYRKVTEIMRGDEVLRTGQSGRGGRAGGSGPTFGEGEYYLAFLGTPSTTAIMRSMPAETPP